MKLQLVATCMFGLERLVGQEIDALGGKRTETMDGRIYFEGDERTLVRANFRLRCAERVIILMGRFPAASFEELFEGTKALPSRSSATPSKANYFRCRIAKRSSKKQSSTACLPNTASGGFPKPEQLFGWSFSCSRILPH